MNIVRFCVFYLTLFNGFLIVSPSAISSELWFPPELISEGRNIADLSRFKHGLQLPGIYTVDLYINQRFAGNRKISFIPEKQGGALPSTDPTGLVPLLTYGELIASGIRREAFSYTGNSPLNPYQLVVPGKVIPDATSFFDFHKMRLQINVPQRWMERRPRNWAPPELWDEGINAGLLNWAFSGANRTGRDEGTSYYLRINSGINYGAWRLRDDLTFSQYASTRIWEHQNLWIERGIPGWRSTIKIGDALIGDKVFDPAHIRGVSLMTDDDMYPDSQRGYAPVVRGMALSNAHITIRQRGNIIYEMNVSPGEFLIDDIDPLYSSGELEVTVKEADGSIRVFSVPYATLPDLLRQGQIKYSLSAGYLREGYDQNSAQPAMFQATIKRGLAHDTTLWGGAQLTRNYQAMAVGAGLNMRSWGALTAGITHSQSMQADGTHYGQSLQVLYSRSFQETGTTIQLAGYRYSTGEYFSLEENQRNTVKEQIDCKQNSFDCSGTTLRSQLEGRRRERMELTLSQQMAGASSMYLSGSRQTYWDERRPLMSLQAGISTTVGLTGVSLSYTESYSPYYSRADRGIYLSLSLPLNRLIGGANKPLYAAMNMKHSSDGETAEQTVLGGSALEKNALTWSVGQTHSRRSGNSENLRLSYKGRYGQSGLGWSQGSDYKQLSYDASGGLVLHSGGITAGPSLGRTTILVETSGLEGVPLAGGDNVVTDKSGYAIQPWASEFKENRVAIDVSRLDEQTEVRNPVLKVVPTRGAVVRARFSAKTGYRLLLALSMNGKPLPLGATVTSDDSNSIVGDRGEVYLSGIKPSGRLYAKWGKRSEDSCHAEWHISSKETVASVIRSSADCR